MPTKTRTTRASLLVSFLLSLVFAMWTTTSKTCLAFVMRSGPAVRAARTMAPRPVFSRLFSSFGDDDAMTRYSGVVKWFDTIKGFGFIVPDDDDKDDVFVHQTAIQMTGFRSLADGERVEFSMEADGSGRYRAVQVTGPDGSRVQGAPYRPPPSEY